MEAKKISVIIPTYNRKEKLPACVDSVLAQTYQNIEVLVVDDASTDGTEELFREISDPRVKATVRNFPNETNMSVITEDGSSPKSGYLLPFVRQAWQGCSNCLQECLASSKKV